MHSLMIHLPRTVSVLLIGCFLATAGCDNPADGKVKAEVGSAKAVSSNKASGTSFSIDVAASKFEFVGSKAVGSHPGGFKKFNGAATLAGDKIEGGSVEVEIDMESTFSDSEKLTGHLKNEDFFDVPNHKTSKFVSTSIEKGGKDATHTITGNLTLRGKTKSIKFPATIAVDGDAATVKAEFFIKRQDYDIVYKGKADNLIKDEVVIKLDLKLKKK